MKPISCIIVLFLLFLPSIAGATIKGSVYTLYYEPVTTALIKINTVPEQRMVSKDANYLFEVSKGEYTLTATYVVEDEIFTIEEKITVPDRGLFVIDLILLPIIDQDLLQDPLVDEFITITDSSHWVIYLILGIFLASGIVGFFLWRRRHRLQSSTKLLIEQDEDLEKVFDFIKHHSGRTTQRDIRKHFLSLSEAKISLILTELETKQKITKIKKGRSNVILLKR